MTRIEQLCDRIEYQEMMRFIAFNGDYDASQFECMIEGYEPDDVDDEQWGLLQPASDHISPAKPW